MQEEISLREIIEVIWKGKVLITVITITAILLSSLYSLFVATPVYESTAFVRVNMESDDATAQLTSYAETLKSDVSLNRIVEKLQLDNELFTIASLRESVAVKMLNGTNVVKLSIKGTDPDIMTKITNLLAFEFGARTEIGDRSDKIVSANNRIEEIDDDIVILQGEISETAKQLENTPEILVTRRTLADEPYLLSVIKEESSTNNSARSEGAMGLIYEEVNPLYTSLKSRYADSTISLNKLLEEKANLESNIQEHQVKIGELESQINNEKLKARNSERLLNGFNAVFISPAIESSEPIGPNKKVIVAISTLLALIISIVIVLLRHYWNVTNTLQNNKEHDKHFS